MMAEAKEKSNSEKVALITGITDRHPQVNCIAKFTEIPQSEMTPFYPRSSYGETFVTRSEDHPYAVAKIHLSLQEEIISRSWTKYQGIVQRRLGNLDAKRDWGYARDYVEAMWLILQQDKRDDFVIATGENLARICREFVEKSTFGHIGTEIVWEGKGDEEIGKDKSSDKILVRVDPKYYRPAEVDLLLGTAKKAENVLGWKPKTNFEELVNEMMEADIALMKANPKA